MVRIARWFGYTGSRDDWRVFIENIKIGMRAKSAKWLALTLLNVRRQVRIRISGVPIRVRTLTPDLEVAMSCLGGEFDRVCGAVPTLEHNLIIDAGGYIGTAAIAFAKKYPRAAIVSLEPNTGNFGLLAANTAPWPNIIAMNKALASERSVSELFDRGTGEWGFTLIETAADRTTSRIESVECVTVDQILDQIGSAGADIIKIDIEGGEHALLSRNIGWINKTKAICIELHDRIVPGCSAVWQTAVAGRYNFHSDGEKEISLKVA